MTKVGTEKPEINVTDITIQPDFIFDSSVDKEQSEYNDIKHDKITKMVRLALLTEV